MAKRPTDKQNPRRATQRGRLIVVDGIDGSGKATQTELLRDRLTEEKVPVKTIDFPRYEDNFFGELIGHYLSGEYGDFIKTDPRVASTLYAADRFESSRTIRTWLGKGYTVIADRYVSANQIHQGGKFDDARERREFMDWLDRMEHTVYGIPRPDLVIYLDVPYEISKQWLQKKVAEREKQGKQDVAEDNLRHLKASRNAALSLTRRNENWEKVTCCARRKDGMVCMAPEEVHERVIEILRERLGLV